MLGLALAVCGFSLQGTVHTAVSGEPIAHALIATTDGLLEAESDSTGRYRLACLPATTRAVRFSRIGFDSRTIEVAAAEGATIRLDIELSALPVTLPSVEVAGRRSPPRQMGFGPSDTVELGTRSFITDDLSQSPLVGDPDPLLALPVPDALTGGGPSAGLHVRGGSADQNLTLLDGVPVYNPYHAGAASALSAAAVSRVTLQSGVPPARWGGGLASVAAVETRTANDKRVAWDGNADPLWIGQFWSSRILGGAGDLLVGGRVRNELLGLQDHGRGARGGDGLGRVTVPLFGGGLELLLFGSQDRVGFDAQSVSGDRSADSVAAGTPGNTFASTTQTEALMWTGPAGRRAKVEFRVWRAAFDATANWLAAAPLLVESGLRNLGGAAVLSGTLLSSQGEIGIEADRFGTTYRVRDVDPGAAAGHFLDQTAAPVILAAFLEDRWLSPGGRWVIMAGLRSALTPSGRVALEPRLRLRFAPTPAVTLTAAYGESRQYVQSLGNAESIIGMMVGTAFPVAADGRRVPVAWAAQSTGSITLRPASGITVTVDAYQRRMDGLLLEAPVTAQPFAINSIAVGSGQASGALLSFEDQTPRVTIQGIYAFERTTLSASGASYSPAADAAHSLAAGIGVRVPDGVSLRAAIWTSLGRRTSLIGDSLAWTPATELGGIGDMDGTPQHIRGPLDGQALPGYMRLDLGLRREWSSIFGRAVRLMGSITVNNVLGRANVAAMLEPVNVSTAKLLYLTGRTVSVRLVWSHQ